MFPSLLITPLWLSYVFSFPFTHPFSALSEIVSFLSVVFPTYPLELPLEKSTFGLGSLKGVFRFYLVLDISLEYFRHVGIGIFDRMLFRFYLSFADMLLKVLEALVTRFTVFDSVFLLLSG